ncbi:MAG TPA: hypothetical protein VFX97_17615 [Pyrinomonadaceae bacterium]|nr:hypothetical protein [Pyrinomonadaceae bacterium]
MISHPQHLLHRFRGLIVVAAVVFAASLVPLSAPAQFLHPKIVKKETTIRNVVVLPAKVDITRDSMKGPEGMAAESEAVSERVAKMVSDALANKQVATLSGPGDGAAEQKYGVADIQSRYDDLLPKIMKKRSDVKKARFTMGDEVLNLNLDKNADAIVFIRGKGQKQTSGKTAFRLLVGGVPAYLMVNIGIVDARTGEVLLYTDGVITGDPTANEGSLRHAITKALKKLPGGAS